MHVLKISSVFFKAVFSSIVFLTIFFLSINARADRARFSYEMNDVSILMPLPHDLIEAEEMIGLETQGQFGEVLPDWVWKKIPTLRSGIPREELKPEIKLVGVRFDPCFREGFRAHEQDCRVQIRFVLQPITSIRSSNKVTTRDTALHLFYELPRPELMGVIHKIQDLSASVRHLFEKMPLGIHPLLASSRYDSSVHQEFKNILLKSIGEARLARVTFMTLAGADIQWTFGGFDISLHKDIVDIKIPGIQKLRQTITSDITFPVPMQSSIVPVSKAADSLSIFSRGAEILKMGEETQSQLMQAVHRVENPQHHNPGTVDCVSCHLTTMARAWSEDHRLKNAKESSFSYKSSFNIDNFSQVNPRRSVLRAFGYFESESAISSRTIHETAEVVKGLN